MQVQRGVFIDIDARRDLKEVIFVILIFKIFVQAEFTARPQHQPVIQPIGFHGQAGTDDMDTVEFRVFQGAENIVIEKQVQFQVRAQEKAVQPAVAPAGRCVPGSLVRAQRRQRLAGVRIGGERIFAKAEKLPQGDAKRLVLFPRLLVDGFQDGLRLAGEILAENDDLLGLNAPSRAQKNNGRQRDGAKAANRSANSARLDYLVPRSAN